MTERIWIIVAAILVITAAIFLWRNNLSAAFVIATLGAVAWFMSYRVQLRAKIAGSDHSSPEQPTIEESDEN